MRSFISKRLDALEEKMTEKLFVCVLKGRPPYAAFVQRPGSGTNSAPVILNDDEALSAFVTSLPKGAQIVDIMCENATGLEILEWFE